MPVFVFQTLRQVLDSSGLSSVGIVASDDRFKGIAANMLKDPALNDSITIIGSAAHKSLTECVI